MAAWSWQEPLVHASRPVLSTRRCLYTRKSGNDFPYERTAVSAPVEMYPVSYSSCRHIRYSRWVATTRPDRKLRFSTTGAEDSGATPTASGISRSGARTFARALTGDDASAFVALAEESAQFHRKWIKLPTDCDSFERYLAGFDNENAFCFVVCNADSIVGSVSLTGIEGEPYHRGRIGCGVFEQYAKMGYMSFGLEFVIRLAFEDLELHRIEADIQPKNHPSKRLIKKMDFICEGVSEEFIRINGEWVDHERWALTSGKWRKRSQ
jgi:[ribosomal protein S5]-alanine N-acetyltransferase